MKILDLDALDRAPLGTDPCEYVVVPRFVRPELLESVNRDYPAIDQPGNFEPEQLRFGPSFQTLLSELHSPELRERFGAKFGVDLTPFPLQMTVRKWTEPLDGNVHNDSKSKVVTALIYFNEHWTHRGGRLRLLRDPDDIESYSAEVVPEQGTLLAFRRSETSYHGFHGLQAERRSLQMYWVKPKRVVRDGEGGEKRLTLKRRFKRWMKQRS